MKGPPAGFWGKLRRESATGLVVEWHPLLAHCADVAACTEALLRRTILRQRFAALAGRTDLSDVTVEKLSFLAALHDIGKFNHGFQRKGDLEPRDTSGHVREVLAILPGDERIAADLRRVLAQPEWTADAAAERLLFAAIGHHGRPARLGAGPRDYRLWEAQGARDPVDGVRSLVGAAARWFPRAAERDEPLPEVAAFHHAFAGLVMLADWLGSDRQVFSFADSDEDRMPFARDRARLVVAELGLDPAVPRELIARQPFDFRRLFSFPPRPAQQAVVELGHPRAGSITVFESETGSGKTEAALARFLLLFRAGLVDGMTFALPTRTAATQIHERVVRAVERTFEAPETRPAVVLAVPGYIQVDGATGRRLDDFEVLWNDSPSERIRHRGWAAEQPKRFLGAAIAVGTIDQVLLSALRVSHAHLRATALLRHLLVVDEVHASDVYMNRILEEVLRFHVGAGGHAFLMSATLGSEVRKRLEAAGVGRRAIPGAFDAALEVPYPAIHDSPIGGSGVTITVPPPEHSKRIEVSVAPLGDEPESVVRLALDAARIGARVLILRNTVNDAVQTQLALEQSARPEDSALLFQVRGVRALHHSRYAREDRIALDHAIEERIGKQGQAGVGCVVVATQTVQQSLDLDVDYMFTDLAPMDVLLQRFGRLHRHRERDSARPDGFRTACAVVLVGEKALGEYLTERGDAQGPHGIGRVYEDLLILEATRRRLEPSTMLLIPEDNRELVEVTTHPEVLQKLAQQLGGRWSAHRERVYGTELARKNVAALNLVDREGVFGDYEFSDEGLAERIATRLGESDRRVRFASPIPGPFGLPVRELNLPGWMLRNESAASDMPSEPTDVVIEPGGVTFCFCGGHFSYGRLGVSELQ